MPRMKDKVQKWVCDYFEKSLLPACYDVLIALHPEDAIQYEEYVEMVHDIMVPDTEVIDNGTD